MKVLVVDHDDVFRHVVRDLVGTTCELCFVSDTEHALEIAGGPELDRRRIEVPDPIKTAGTHQVRVRLHPEVTATIDLEVVAG